MTIGFDPTVPTFTNNGDPIDWSKIRLVILSVENDCRDELSVLARQYIAGDITLSQLHNRAMGIIQTFLIIALVIAMGGLDNMTDADWNKVSIYVEEQFGFLNNFMSDVENQKQSIDGVENRLQLYGGAVWSDFETELGETFADGDATEEIRILGNADHCDDCVDYAAMGWQPIGTLPDIGDSICGNNCHCEFDYR